MTRMNNARRRATRSKDHTPTHKAESGLATNPEVQSATSGKSVSTFHLAHSDVIVADSRAGYIARIERDTRVEYAGPLDYATVLSLAEVAR